MSRSALRDVLIKQIDRTLIDALKANAAFRGHTMRDVLEALIKAYIQNPAAYRVLTSQERRMLQKFPEKESIYLRKDGTPKTAKGN